MCINTNSEGFTSEVGEKEVLNLDLISISLKYKKNKKKGM